MWLFVVFVEGRDSTGVTIMLNIVLLFSSHLTSVYNVHPWRLVRGDNLAETGPMEDR